jgi:uncharacterized lipoprotein YmbA
MTIRTIVCALLMSAFISGCGFCTRPTIRYYSLEPIAPLTAVGVTAVAGLPIAVDGVELPPGLDRQGIVVREANHRLEMRGTELWAAPLERMVLHTIAYNLARRLPEGMVILPGQAQPPGGRRSLFVLFERLVAGPEEMMVLEAQWVLRGRTPAAADQVRHETITVPLQSLDSEQIAAAMSAALATLTDRIVATLAAE